MTKRKTGKKLTASAQKLIDEYVGGSVDKSVAAALAKHTQPRSNHIDQLFDGSTRGGDAKPGTGFARVLRTLAREGTQAAIKSGNEFPNSEVRALGAGDATAGGVTIMGELAAEIIDLLRPMSVVRMMQPRVIRAERGTMSFPKLTSGASASYVSENADIEISEEEFGDISLVMRKLAGLVPLSNELIKFSNNSADEMVRDDLVQVLATTEDQKFLRGDGKENSPTGLRNQALAANILGTNGTTSTQIENDFKDLVNALEEKDVPMIRPAWIMAPRSKNHLRTLRETNGNLTFPEIRNSVPTIFEFPVMVTNNIPTNLGSGSDETEVMLVDASQVVIGEVASVDVAVSTEASYRLTDGNVVSAFQREQTLIRATLHHDLAVRHAEAIALKSDVTWGA